MCFSQPASNEEEERFVQVKVDMTGEMTMNKLVQLLLVHLKRLMGWSHENLLCFYWYRWKAKNF
jgi:hypothetical protein